MRGVPPVKILSEKFGYLEIELQGCLGLMVQRLGRVTHYRSGNSPLHRVGPVGDNRNRQTPNVTPE